MRILSFILRFYIIYYLPREINRQTLPHHYIISGRVFVWAWRRRIYEIGLSLFLFEVSVFHSEERCHFPLAKVSLSIMTDFCLSPLHKEEFTNTTE